MTDIARMLRLICCVIVLLFWQLSSAQPARVLNASFEGEPRDATMPRGWYPCEEGTTPDILPGPFGVYQEADAGETYLGLITRENGTWESIGQKLSKSLEKGLCYYFSISLCRSDTYMGYDKPIKMRVWGGKSKCDRTQLLAESELIENTEWESFTFDFTPTDKIRYIVIEAFYKDGMFAHRGNVLIDNLTPIKQCNRAMLQH